MVTENRAVSAVLPAYNEEETIEETVEKTMATLDLSTNISSYEVIIAEDGCDDMTPEIADELADKNDCVFHFHSDERLGRGGALTSAFRQCRGDILVYFDTDLATDMAHLQELVKRIHSGGYDVATGSRWLSSSDADRPVDRKSASWVYNRLIRLFLGSKLQDHQCGFKAFDREALYELLPVIENKHWFWDTEVLVRAQWQGLDVSEFPVNWEPKPDTKVNLISDASRMGREILRLWWHSSVKRRINPVRDLPLFED